MADIESKAKEILDKFPGNSGLRFCSTCKVFWYGDASSAKRCGCTDVTEKPHTESLVRGDLIDLIKQYLEHGYTFKD